MTRSHPVQLGLTEPLLRGLLGDAQRVPDLLPAPAVLPHKSSGPAFGHVDVAAGLSDHVKDDLRIAAGSPYGFPISTGFQLFDRTGQQPVEDFTRVFVALNLHSSRVLDTTTIVKRS